MDFNIPADIQDLLDQLDQFIEDEIKPLERENDNIRFFFDTMHPCLSEYLHTQKCRALSAGCGAA